jgi:hypothetical protein
VFARKLLKVVGAVLRAAVRVVNAAWGGLRIAMNMVTARKAKSGCIRLLIAQLTPSAGKQVNDFS